MGDVKEKSFQPKDVMRVKNESGEEDIHYSVLYEGLPPEYQLLTERKLGETPANKDKGLRTLKEFLNNMRFDHYSVEDTETVTLCFVLYLLTFPMSTVCGVSYIADCKCDSILVFYPVVKSFKNTYIPHLLNMPMRYGRADILFENVLIRILHGALCFLLPKKLSDRASFHGNSYKRLHSIYHPDMLPKELEGNMEPINNRHYKERLVNFIKTLKEEGKKRAFSDMN